MDCVRIVCIVISEVLVSAFLFLPFRDLGQDLRGPTQLRHLFLRQCPLTHLGEVDVRPQVLGAVRPRNHGGSGLKEELEGEGIDRDASRRGDALENREGLRGQSAQVAAAGVGLVDDLALRTPTSHSQIELARFRPVKGR